MKLSCVPLNFYRQLGHDKSMSNEDWIDMAVDLGLDATEIYENFVGDLDAAGKAKLVNYVRERGLEVSQFTSEPHLCNPEGRAAGLAHIRGAVDNALVFGTRIVRVVSGHGSRDLEREVVLESIADGLKGSLDYAEREGVTLAFEDHWEVGTNIPDFMRILELVDDDRLKVNLDTANVGSENIVALTELVKDRVVHTHCSELLNNKHGIVIGKGEVDFRSVLGILKSNGYDGWVSLEPLAGDRDDLQFSVNYIRDVWNSL